MSVLKDFRFQVDVDHPTGKTVRLTAPGKPELEIATPPEFRGGVPNVWSPEDLLVAAVASCYALTLAAVFERRAVPLHELAVAGAGHMTKRADGGFGFVVVELGVTLTTDEGRENEAQKAARAAESACLVANALAVPVEVELELRTKPAGVPALAVL
jgi:organic hydroperoxide reductase OsmC/OhrA